MNADREANHDMTDRDIALLLADAADGVEIGIAPTQAVIRGGRRRRARRWAVATAAALAIVGSTGTIALAGLPGEGGHRVAPSATQPTTTLPDAFRDKPQRTTLAIGTDHGKQWEVFIDLWGAPRDETEAQAQLAAMGGFGEQPAEVRTASGLVGKSSYFLRRTVGDDAAGTIMFNTLKKFDPMSGTDMQAAATPLKTGGAGPSRLVVGQVAKTAQRVTCTWKDGTKTEVRRVPAGYGVNSDEQVIRPADGSPVNWFVCLAPEGTAYKSAEVTR